THLTRLLLPGMIKQRAGKILNVASTAAFQPGPLMAVYYASKAYVLSFSEALANELRGTGVTVTALCPGPTRTNFQSRAGVGDSLLGRSGAADAASVARAGYRGLMAGKSVVIPGLRNRVLAFLVRLAPRALVTQIVRGIQEKRAAA
ncbi:MAG: SDR family NAD(P)-dependent oxidoreductase, partial [Candidatus Omnitrophica bacterium]|nr:SDR family NAD(P)-dependent oxidoreductase [Candidatus Omnitrophota bacterium]